MSDWAIVDGGYALDGGTISLTIADPEGRAHTLVLAQHQFPQSDLSHLRGRLYWDGTLIGIRSEREAEIVAVLRRAEVRLPDLSNGAESTAPRRHDSARRAVIGADIQDFLSAVDRGPVSALSHLQHAALAFIGSAAYVDGHE